MAISRLPGVHRVFTDSDLEPSTLTSRVMHNGMIDSSRLESPNFIKTGNTGGISLDVAGWYIRTPTFTGFPTTIDKVLYAFHCNTPPSGLRYFMGASALPPSAVRFWVNIVASCTVSGARGWIEYLVRGH